MTIYRQVQTSFWQDPFILDLTPEEKYFYLYLMTNTKTSACGIYVLPKQIIAMETGYNRETVDKLLKKFIEYGKILYSEEAKEIILLNWLKYNNFSGTPTQSCIKKELNLLKTEAFKEIVLQTIYPLDTPSIPPANPMGEQEHEQEERTRKHEQEHEEQGANAQNAFTELSPAGSSRSDLLKNKSISLTECEFDKLIAIKIGNGAKNNAEAREYVLNKIAQLIHKKKSDSTFKVKKSDFALLQSWIFADIKDSKGKVRYVMSNQQPPPQETTPRNYSARLTKEDIK